MSSRYIRPLMFASVLALAGCSTPPTTPVPWDAKQLESFGKLARSPAMFAITVYPEQGGARFAGGFRLHEGQLAELKFKTSGKNTAPIIELKPGGPGEFNALIDTSSRESWLALEGVRNSNMIPMGPPMHTAQPSHVVDSIGGLLCLAPKLRFDELEMEDALFYAYTASGPFGPPARGETKPPPDAILGAEALKAFSYVHIDFAQRHVIFSSTREYQPNAAALIAEVPLKEVAGAIGCSGVIDGEPAVFILDTGGNYGMAMRDPPVRPMRQVSIGDLVFRDVTAESTDRLGLGLPRIARIGRQKLARFTVTLDFKNRLVIFERPMSE